MGGIAGGGDCGAIGGGGSMWPSRGAKEDASSNTPITIRITGQVLPKSKRPPCT